ncbi:hypothetical protein BD410DRAFT_809049 [Rickenella mellea]|uniref:Uncharacterized protein n=1 Tax=Rickenella mellea TaxID=50990 RepID=A0A4Y7PJL9_9AGAM|nr:hypothetical protein BD410DRAFT_809049 [Rickenella mellea]
MLLLFFKFFLSIVVLKMAPAKTGKKNSSRSSKSNVEVLLPHPPPRTRSTKKKLPKSPAFVAQDYIDEEAQEIDPGDESASDASEIVPDSEVEIIDKPLSKHMSTPKGKAPPTPVSRPKQERRVREIERRKETSKHRHASPSVKSEGDDDELRKTPSVENAAVVYHVLHTPDPPSPSPMKGERKEKAAPGRSKVTTYIQQDVVHSPPTPLTNLRLTKRRAVSPHGNSDDEHSAESLKQHRLKRQKTDRAHEVSGGEDGSHPIAPPRSSEAKLKSSSSKPKYIEDRVEEISDNDNNDFASKSHGKSNVKSLDDRSSRPSQTSASRKDPVTKPSTTPTTKHRNQEASTSSASKGASNSIDERKETKVGQVSRKVNDKLDVSRVSVPPQQDRSQSPNPERIPASRKGKSKQVDTVHPQAKEAASFYYKQDTDSEEENAGAELDADTEMDGADDNGEEVVDQDYIAALEEKLENERGHHIKLLGPDGCVVTKFKYQEEPLYGTYHFLPKLTTRPRVKYTVTGDTGTAFRFSLKWAIEEAKLKRDDWETNTLTAITFQKRHRNLEMSTSPGTHEYPYR